MNEYRTIKISKGDEYKVTGEILMNFISTLGINFFNDFDIQVKKFSDNEWIIKILDEKNNYEEVKNWGEIDLL